MTRGGDADALALIRAGWGACLLSAPERVIHAVPGAQATPGTLRVARALGTRHLVQAAAVVAGSAVARRGWWIDAAHCASMVGLAIVAPAQRRLAVLDAAIAGTFAIATLVTGGQRQATARGRPGAERTEDQPAPAVAGSSSGAVCSQRRTVRRRAT